MARVLPLMLQLLWTACGVAAAFLVGSHAAWAYPQGAGSVWGVTWGSVVVILILSGGPVLRAARLGGRDHRHG